MNETLELSSSVKLTYLEMSKEEKSEKKCFGQKILKKIKQTEGKRQN